MNIKMIGAALALGLLAGCAAAFAPKAGGDTRSAEKSGAEGGETCTAMYVPLGNGSYILVDQDSGSVFTICVPEQVLDAGGEPMAFEDLRAGNILKITGDGVMLYSYPGQYPGVTQVQLVQEGSPEDAEQYEELADSLCAEPDPSEPPSLNIEYRTARAAVCAAVTRGSYEWSLPLEGGQTQSEIACGPHVLQWSELAGLSLPEPAELTLHFYGTEAPVQVTVYRWPSSLLGAEAPEDLASPEEVETLLRDGDYVIPEAESGFVYEVAARWEQGRAEFGFLTQ
ncbi:MAG: hypothetical protein SOX72_03480 [Oscillospiraceae bacterium]|nr:hypothetical protein [Oscillospiraceae bacterium]